MTPPPDESSSPVLQYNHFKYDQMPHDHTPARRNKGRLAAVLGLTSTYMMAEVVAGFWTGSLALLADAGHMLADVGGLALALLAITYAERPANPRRTYGYHRLEILATLANGVALVALSIFIFYEAIERLRNPPEVASGAMLIVAALGLLINIAGVFMLRAGSSESLNVKGAYLEVLSDAIASVGVIVAAAIMALTGWYAADPLISAAIGLFILPRTWSLLSSAVNVLLEGVPEDVDLRGRPRPHRRRPGRQRRPRPARLVAHLRRQRPQRPRRPGRWHGVRPRALGNPPARHREFPRSARHRSGGTPRLDGRCGRTA